MDPKFLFVFLRIDYDVVHVVRVLTFCEMYIHDAYKKGCNAKYRIIIIIFLLVAMAIQYDRSVVNYLEKRPSFYKRLEIKSCGLHRGFAQGMQKISRVNIVTRISALGVINVYLVRWYFFSNEDQLYVHFFPVNYFNLERLHLEELFSLKKWW